MNKSIMEKVLKALANSRRLAILKFLKNNKKPTVTEIARHIRLSVKATSKHLRILLLAEVLEKEQSGLLVFYRLADEKPIPLEIILTVL